jgi:hypothetical protein
VQLHRCPVGGGGTGALDALNSVNRELMQPTDEVNADAVLNQRGRLSLDRLGKECEEPSYLSIITTPVLSAKGVDGEVGDAKFRRARNDATKCFGASGMSIKLIATLRTRPATVAIHDDGDVAR